MKKLLMGILVLATGVAQATTRYLSASGSNTAPYDEPAKAATDLATVMGAAEAGDEIRVFPGTYRPTAAIVGKGVTLRSYDANGALDAANTVFDGTDYAGEGPLLAFASIAADKAPQFKGLTFRKFAKSVMSFTSMTGVGFEDCVFEQNGGADVTDGGAVSLTTCKDARFVRTKFVGNSATGKGGAVCFDSSRGERNGIFEDCAFSSNGQYRATSGGAVYANRELLVSNCRFADNTTKKENGTWGGSLYTCANSQVLGCTFTGEADAAYGKCLYLTGGTVSNCLFTGINVIQNQNYGLIALSGSLMTDCSVVRSAVSTRILHVQSSSTVPTVVRNWLVADNTTHAGYFSVFASYKSAAGVVFDNCTILTPGKEVFKNSSSAVPYKFRNSVIVADKWVTTPGSETYTVENCTDLSSSVASLKFVDAENGNYIPRSDSPLLDRADPLDWQANGAVDRGGRPRTVGDKVDLGCYERQETDRDYTLVRAVATAAEKTGEWADATVGLQPAIDAVVGNATHLLVKSGVYAVDETIQITNKSLVVVSCGADGKPDRDGTVLDGQKARRILRIVPSALNSSGVPTANRRVTFEGFTFKDGKTVAGDGQEDAGFGGGLYLVGRASAKGLTPSQIVGCRFTGCQASYGGAVSMTGGELVDCVFDHNTAATGEETPTTTTVGGQGGAVGFKTPAVGSYQSPENYTRDMTWFAPGVIGCTFRTNSADRSGGAVAGYQRGGQSSVSTQTAAYIADSAFEGNVITWPAALKDYTGATCIDQVAYALIDRCDFTNNVVTGIGYGAVYPGNGCHILRSAFVGNNAVYGILFISASYGPNTLVESCRFVDNLSYVRLAGAFRNCLFSADNSYCFYVNGDTSFENCTIMARGVSDVGYFSSGSYALKFGNGIVWRASGRTPIESPNNCSCAFSNCCLSKEPTAKDKMTFDQMTFFGDPKFADYDGGDWSLRKGSPCIDKGALLDWMTVDSLDLAGNPRVFSRGQSLAQNPNAKPDMGCFENQHVPTGLLMLFR